MSRTIKAGVRLAVLFLVSIVSGVGNAGAAPATLAERGAYLAKAGDCIACHSVPGGKPYAGGLPMKTPVGTIYSTNITADAEHGIGKWSLPEFDAALRKGVSKDGHNLYPAMPYPSYAKLSSEDVAALYAYFIKSVEPVKQANRPSEIPFPLNARWPLKFWNLVFLDSKTYQNKPDKSAEWNRGAYLTQSLGHCGACHTARGFAFQEKALDEAKTSYLGGAEIDGWFASSLTADPREGIGRWSKPDLMTFLRTGANRHATAFGPMTDVINNSTQYLSDADLSSMAFYLKSLGGTAEPRSVVVNTHPIEGARIYGQYCVHCHGSSGAGSAPLLAPLAGNPNVAATQASSLINVSLNGSGALVIGGVPAAYPMPGFAKLLNDRELAQVLTYIRGQWGEGAPVVLPEDVAKIRRNTK